jgi:hypothetical protein
MGMFQHPHLTRGIVRTPKGAFVITRGLVEVPDELGEALGWQPADVEDEAPKTGFRSNAPVSGASDGASDRGERA